jgi:hypothetical protein
MTKPAEGAETSALDPDVLALLEHAKPIPALDPAKKAAMLADVFSKIGTSPPGGGEGGGGGGGEGVGVGGGAGAGAGAIGSKIALGVVFAIGVAAGVVGDRALTDRAQAPVAPSAPVTTIVIPSVSAPAPESTAAVPVGELPSAPVPTVAKSVKPASEPVPSARGLAAERALLDIARSDLARGEASAALDAAERHRREYPDGALVEEREAIAIKALVALGRKDEAAQRLAHLEKTHPNSMVLRAAKKAVSGAP